VGIILDSSAIIAGERKGRTAAEVLSGRRSVLGAGPIAMSVISTMELEHGIWRAKDALIATKRKQFFADLFSVVPEYPVTGEIARHAARIDAEAKNKGIVVPMQDLLIGVTALEFDYAVATLNVRHFQLIPDLIVKPL
jgi:predicted nucleic acid-binding protein